MAENNQRNAYGRTLVELCRENENIVVLDADLAGSTMGKMIENEPDIADRHIEMGIAEANMISTAGGLARVGKIPFCSSFAVCLRQPPAAEAGITSPAQSAAARSRERSVLLACFIAITSCFRFTPLRGKTASCKFCHCGVCNKGLAKIEKSDIMIKRRLKR